MRWNIRTKRPELLKIKEIIEKEEGLQEISQRLADKQKELKSLNSFDIVKKQRGVSQTKLRSRPGAFAA